MAKILYVFDNLEFGGGERVFAQIINRLSRERYKIMVACLPTGAFIEKIEGSEVQIKPVDMRNRFNLKVILQLADLMKGEKIDIVHSQGARADFFARMAAKLTRVPIVISTVAMPVEGFDVNPMKRLIYIALNRFSERFVNRFMVVSDALEKMMIEKYGVESQRVVKIYNGIDIDEYCIEDEKAMYSKSGFRKELGLENDTQVIGAIGRLVWQKGFECFIEAIPNVLKEFPETMFVIVGEGALKEKLKVKSEKLKVKDSLIFTGFRSDIKEVLASIDILVMPSLLEGFPMITLEAMAMAKPIIATDIDGIREQIEHDKSGFLIPPKNPDVLANAIIFLLKNREKAEKLGLKAKQKVKEQFSKEEMIEKTKGVYEALLASNS